jgi:flagellar biosynthesis anti-sigma factor FlgM
MPRLQQKRRFAMKVGGDQTSIQMDAYLKKIQSNRLQPSDNQRATPARAKSDSVELSDNARALQQAAQALNAGENERAERVERVKMEVEKGTYKVAAAKVATDMLREAVENTLILNKIDTHA